MSSSNQLCNYIGCTKKLTLFDKTKKCRCGLFFCREHFHFTKHNCQYDYKEEQKNELKKEIKKIKEIKNYHQI